MKGLLILILATSVAHADLVVNEYFGVKYRQEPVSFDVPFVPNLGLDGVPSQVEIVESGKTARIWTLVDFDAPGRKTFTVGAPVDAKPWSVAEAGSVGGVKIAAVDNGQFFAKVPVGSVKFDVPVSAFKVPGPVVSVSGDGKQWHGTGYLDSMLRVKEIRCELNVGAVFWQSRITYLFEDDKAYVAQVRIYKSKPYAQLVEDFNLGGASKFIFNYDDWFPFDFISCADSAQTKHRRIGKHDANDFVTEEGSTCLVRLVVWSQFGYFNGKSETIGLMNEDGSLAVGGFYVRPDRWTRAKVNHVDLYRRPEVPGDRMTRGIVGLQGARDRLAMEAWLVDGHREWAIFAMPAGKWKEPPSEKGDGSFLWRPEMRKAHVLEGVWPLDRLNRSVLCWNGDGVPTGPAGGDAGLVLVATDGRSGLQAYNGSEGRLRGTSPSGGWNGQVNLTTNVGAMASTAINAYMSSDDSAYPSFRAMLPWTDPEALNPFYQGMENMNFNADRYRYTLTYGLRLAAMGHPDAKRFIEHAERSFDMALDRYVYPQSGCWEESHGYAGHTIRTVTPLVKALRTTAGYKDFTEDVRFARMMEFFVYAQSPKDADFGRRIVPPIGDHGLSTDGPSRRFAGTVDLFTGSKQPEIQRIVRNVSWMIDEDGGSPPEGIVLEKPDLGSRWLQGYGAVLRGFRPKGQRVRLELAAALGGAAKPAPLTLLLNRDGDKWSPQVTGTAAKFNTAVHTGTVAASGPDASPRLHVDMTVNADKWVKGGTGSFDITFDRLGTETSGSFTGTFNSNEVSGKVTGAVAEEFAESFVVVRAGQSWGHHHADKGSLWGWFRNVHFFGDASWGGPPGGTYWNPYKQGAPGHTEIEFVGINNWTLPCKYPAPWISDEHYTNGFDYVNARCLYPYNPPLALTKSSPVAFRNGYDRQVLFVHPDLLIVRDNVETMCPTVWRMHSYQPAGTTVQGNRATLKSSHDVTGELAVLCPAGVELERIDQHDLAEPSPGKFGSSAMLKWNMPPDASATWTFGVHGEKEPAPIVQLLDKDGRVTRVTLADGREVVAFLNIEPFEFVGDGLEFAGTVGLAIRQNGKVTLHAIRADGFATKR